MIITYKHTSNRAEFDGILCFNNSLTNVYIFIFVKSYLYIVFFRNKYWYLVNIQVSVFLKETGSYGKSRAFESI